MSDPATWTVAPAVVGWSRDAGMLMDLPLWAVELFVLLTHLGDSWVLFGLAALTYWAYDRRAGGFVAGTLLVGLAVTYALKAGFGLPRPPDELRHVIASGYGFPSGHALGATVTWGALAVALEGLSTPRRRAVLALVVIVTVAISRVIIGVHYLVDVVAGIAIGLAVLAVAAHWGRDAPLGLFVLATAVALVAVVVPRSGWESVALLGACIGAIIAWQLVEPADRPWGFQGVIAAGVVGGLVAVAMAVVNPMDSLAFVGASLSTVAVLAGPVVRDRWRERGLTDGWARG